jgi:hypothetical protein
MDNYNVSQPQIYPQQAQSPAYTTQSIPVQTQAANPSTQSAQPGVSAVNIVIQNPSASPNPPGMMAYPSNYYTQQPIYNIQQPPTPQPAAPVVESKQIAAAPVSEDKKTDDTNEKKKTKEVVKITDEYIKTLENYLRNPAKEVRIMGARELAKRFEEDKTRRNDRALNSLLNLVIQDKSQSVRAIGLAVLGSGLAQGDETTVKVLQGLQTSSDAYGQDAISASNALLKMSEDKIKIPDDSPDKPKKSEGDKDK